jgi:hypothetical protein
MQTACEWIYNFLYQNALSFKKAPLIKRHNTWKPSTQNSVYKYIPCPFPIDERFAEEVEAGIVWYELVA